ncbi:DUF2059 domain-containing protein [Celeribacter neptunius]|uniref:DUF2059 domain-containing protein n=1 Tax=Celeribacter neptunius TaxID=588602 RepID=A0A1I3LEQ8_9RHOB|nr:DUF2059 domain-containing protein [Celeribacter neptunius]SFI83252.1 hypothetical protein SAMN04487991_0998 [Celeribacter neptunius]
MHEARTVSGAKQLGLTGVALGMARRVRGGLLAGAVALSLPAVALPAALSLFSLPQAAEAAVDEGALKTLMEAMMFDEVVTVLSDEGRSMAEDFVEAGYGVPKPAWDEMLGRLYDPAVMARAFHDEMAKALDGAELAPMVEFFSSDLGQRIARLELDTRKALSDEAAQAAAGEAWAAIDPDTERARLIEEYVEVNDLVEMNVVGAMNSDIAYYQGLWSEGFEMDEGMSDSDLLNQIWSTEPEVRADVSEWVYGFSTLAYSSLSDAELARYVAFARTEAGQRLNMALFATFDAVYDHLSRGLGAGTAVMMQTYDGEQL